MQTELKSGLRRYLKRLNLPTTLASYEAYARQAEQESLSYESYLHELMERECEVRLNNRIKRLLKESHLPLEKNFDCFEIKRLPRKVIQMVQTLREGSFLDRRENILAFGNPGSGKTHLLCAVGQELICQKVRRIYFTCWCRSC